jgi:predicted DsbA family dithiol-disulfide isomerase
MDATKSNFFLVVLVDMIGFLAGHAYGCSTETKCSASYSDYESLAFAAGGAFQSAPYAYSYSFPCEVILTICLLLHFSLGHELYNSLIGVSVQAYWELNEEIADEAVLEHIAQQYNIALPLVFDDSIKDQLHQNTVGVRKFI